MATARKVKIFTHLWDAKDAEAAANFYVSIFPDSRRPSSIVAGTRSSQEAASRSRVDG
jgi:predicted 3-demethylubiquinone-9 3-methyltransferase (glyoxalase superfamily)